MGPHSLQGLSTLALLKGKGTSFWVEQFPSLASEKDWKDNPLVTLETVRKTYYIMPYPTGIDPEDVETNISSRYPKLGLDASLMYGNVFHLAAEHIH